MTFKQVFQEMVQHCVRTEPKFIVVSAKTFKQITARRLMNNCLESEEEVVLSGFANHGNTKVADFSLLPFADTDCGTTTVHNNDFVIIFVKGE